MLKTKKIIGHILSSNSPASDAFVVAKLRYISTAIAASPKMYNNTICMQWKTK